MLDYWKQPLSERETEIFILGRSVHHSDALKLSLDGNLNSTFKVETAPLPSFINLQCKFQHMNFYELIYNL